MRGVFFRSLRPQARATRIRAERRISWLKEIVAYLRRHIDLPATAIPNYPVAPALVDSSAEIENIARLCRERFQSGHGPVAGMVTLVENLGCIVSNGASAEYEPESACSHWDILENGERKPYLLLPGDSGPSQTRFSVAHELGHLIMHSDPEPENADPETHRILEQQADRFARAFLLPAAVFGREVWAPTVDALLSLRKEWNCPLAAMIVRCGEIGVFSADQVRRATANLARRGWKSGEPPQEPVAGETPQLLAGCIRLLIEGGVRDRHALVTDLSLSPCDIEELSGLPRHYLSDCDRPRPASLRLRVNGVNSPLA
jgi:Zn-dependent peptidase ImmA (M78 family)